MNLLQQHQLTELGTCAGRCAATLVPRVQWYRLPLEARHQLIGAGYNRSQARGLCARCYQNALESGTLEDHLRLLRPGPWQVEDFEHIRDTLPRDVSRAERVRRAAERLGTTPGALDMALRRAGAAA